MITGILYLRAISQTRMSGSALKNLSMFRKLCGTNSLQNVVIVTTKWDLVPSDLAEAREKDLMTKFLQPMLLDGAKQARHDNTVYSAQMVLRKVLGNDGIATDLQVDLVDKKKTLLETAAGAAVGEDIDKLRVEHDKEIQNLKKLIEEEKNETIRVLMQQEQQKLLTLEAKAEKDKKTLEADRQKEVAEYERKLEEVANQSGESTTSVLLKGVSDLLQFILDVLKHEYA